MTMVVKSPRETDIVVDAPFQWNVFLPSSDRLMAHDQPSPAWLYNFSTINRDVVHYHSAPNFYLDETSSECYLDQRSATTFDGLTIPFTRRILDVYSNGCELLIAQECSRAALFSVLGSGDSSIWKLRFLVPEREIEFLSRRDGPRVRVDGETINLGPSRSISIRQTPEDFSSRMLYKIEKIGDALIKLTSYNLGLSITVNYVSNTMNIKLWSSSVLQGQLCGICGNYNQDIGDEMSSTSLSRRAIREILRSSMLPSDTCRPSTSLPQDRQQYSGGDMHEMCVTRKNMTIRRQHNDQSVVCESVEPVVVCSSSCRPATTDSWTDVDVCFTCRSEHDGNLFSPYRPAGYEPTTTCENYSQRISIPTACIAT